VPLPHAIHDHAHGDRLLQDGVGQLEAAAAVRERIGIAFTQHRQKMPRLLVTEVIRTAAPADAQVHGLVGVGHTVHERKLRRLRFA
jgi:hypothetical protein